MTGTDPYAVLGIAPSVSDAELRAAYRRAVQRHHPDHNGGSPESARRFEEVQQAYAQVRAARTPGASGGRPRPGARGSSRAGAGASTTDSRLDARLAAMEAELAAARDAQERVRRAARDAVRDVREAARDAAQGSSRRPSDEELGYVSTDDSLGSILDDTLSGLSEHISSARRRADAGTVGGTVTDKVADVFEDIGARLRGERRNRHDG